MVQPNMNINETPDWAVRATEIKTWLTPETMSPLGRRLLAVAQEIAASDVPALDETAIAQELRRRHGVFTDGDGWEKAKAVLAQVPSNEPEDFDKF